MKGGENIVMQTRDPIVLIDRLNALKRSTLANTAAFMKNSLDTLLIWIDGMQKHAHPTRK